MNRRNALKTITASLAGFCGINLAQSKEISEKPRGILGEVTVMYLKNDYVELKTYSIRQQSMNNFARDALKRYPDAEDIKLKLDDKLFCHWRLEKNLSTRKHHTPGIQIQESRWTLYYPDRSGCRDATFLDDPVTKRIFYIDCVKLTPQKQEAFLLKLKERFANQKSVE
jgi:hypothetical protein